MSPPSRQRLAHCVHAAARFALCAQDLGEAIFQLIGARGLGASQLQPALSGARNHDGDDEKEDKGENAESNQRVGGVNRRRADCKKKLVHESLCNRFGLEHERRGNIYGDQDVNFYG